MKNMLIITVAILSVSFGLAQEKDAEKQGVSIEVTIDNITNSNGMVLLSLHTEDTFMKGKGIKNLQSEIKDGKVTMTFTDVPSGTYAILALHDENDNKRMYFEASGMPKEDYGMSNNDMTFGPPQFSDAKFEVENTDMEMTLRF
ncbi:DUF2141 domain-containing protein [Galbibacter mesophilus]|uniref:DUF2141 domain-containing protein n=1 Tax=Galbibacter mesophilus TaxID=379069 RepID=UPI00191CCF06|nr:DUF2141 domain-containing protein [Galbibacter mesophilus]MCM5664295.1 DUF2141 domain-containing protein [Galbibacter mesophilus]